MSRKAGKIVAVEEDWSAGLCCTQVTFSDGLTICVHTKERSRRLSNILMEACDGGRDYAY